MFGPCLSENTSKAPMVLVIFRTMDCWRSSSHLRWTWNTTISENGSLFTLFCFRNACDPMSESKSCKLSQVSLCITQISSIFNTPLKFNSSPLGEWCLEDDSFLLGVSLFSGANWTVSFRGPGRYMLAMLYVRTARGPNSWWSGMVLPSDPGSSTQEDPKANPKWRSGKGHSFLKFV